MNNEQPQKLTLGLNQDHVAIMQKSWHLTEKILSGEKTIESRWLVNRSAPWNKVFPGDRVFFKNSGEPITVMAKVKKVKQYSNLNPPKIFDLLSKYAAADGLGIDRGSLQKFYHLFSGKKYCVFVFLESPQSVSPFEINKKGFGAQTAWIAIADINQLKK